MIPDSLVSPVVLLFSDMNIIYTEIMLDREQNKQINTNNNYNVNTGYVEKQKRIKRTEDLFLRTSLNWTKNVKKCEDDTNTASTEEN